MNTVFNVEKIRADFPILQQSVFGHPLVYFDNAATSQKPRSVIDAITNYYLHDNSNVHRGAHALSQRATDQFELSREKIRKFVNAKDIKEIIFLRGTTEAINLVSQSYGRTFLKAGDEILISELEHHANIVPWQILCQQVGAVLKVAPINDRGEIIIDAFREALNSRTRIVAISHISNALGTINPVKQLTQLAKEVDAIVLIDGAQAAPHQEIDVQAIGCDFYAFSAHKVYGPTGFGVLYGRQELLEKMPPWQGGGEMIKFVSFENTLYQDLPYKFEAGTPHIEGAIGLAAALDYFGGLDKVALHQHEQALLLHAQEALATLPGLRLIGTAEQKACMVSFVLDSAHAHDVGTILDRYGIAVRTGHHCAMPVMEHFKVAATTRASFAFYNTHEEIDRLLVGLTEVKRIFS